MHCLGEHCSAAGVQIEEIFCGRKEHVEREGIDGKFCPSSSGRLVLPPVPMVR
jgi:hypothetical protein